MKMQSKTSAVGWAKARDEMPMRCHRSGARRAHAEPSQGETAWARRAHDLAVTEDGWRAFAHPTKRAEQNLENRRCRIAPTALA